MGRWRFPFFCLIVRVEAVVWEKIVGAGSSLGAVFLVTECEASPLARGSSLWWTSGGGGGAFLGVFVFPDMVAMGLCSLVFLVGGVDGNRGTGERIQNSFAQGRTGGIV